MLSYCRMRMAKLVLIVHAASVDFVLVSLFILLSQAQEFIPQRDVSDQY